jgi:hypothetical protein
MGPCNTVINRFLLELWMWCILACRIQTRLWTYNTNWVAVIIMDKFLIIRPNIINKTGNSRSRYFIFEIFGKPSFVEAVLWWVMQFFYLLCSQFRQKVSGWINKTLLLIKQQKWLSEFCAKISRIIADKKG